ncbi:hypothetical protein H0H81_011114 [Sphagnurus paluster]|uniref:Uncharacterized protein n=1 Tax=Sphagnurus paluster TaxID=117069 RepID=A0A9P7K3K1_9AGAR|nr:hypothetical protein H0H81_011114 [Sphagnurus paluster]
MLTGLEAYRVLKELLPVFCHKINDINGIMGQGSILSASDKYQIVCTMMTDDSSAYSTSRSPMGTISEEEATFYYSGLYSSPRLVYRTGTTPWTMPAGPEAYRVLKELRPVFRHKINDVWDELGPKVCHLLDNDGLLWTSIDIVRFKVQKEDAPVGPVVLWIGVVPETLSSEDARTSANGCLGQ